MKLSILWDDCYDVKLEGANVFFSLRHKDSTNSYNLSLFMKLYGSLPLMCLSLIFIPTYIEAQATQSSTNASSEQYSQLLEKQFFKTGNDLFDQGNYENAIKYYDKALEINSTDINVLYNKALALDSLGRHDEAVSYYDKVLAIKPNDTDSLNNKGLDLDVLGKHDEAISYYDKVLSINPTDADALYNKGLALDNLGKHDQAILFYKQVLDINPKDTGALNKLNLTYNNADPKQIAAIQQTDQSLLIVVGASILVVGSVIVINLARRKSRKILTQNVSKPSVTTKKEEKSLISEIQEKKPKWEDNKDHEWKGI